ncbi:MAG: glycosyltransferase family 9 protein [bacterium]|nr:glycosyltransferase family 9 protein [bacterium]
MKILVVRTDRLGDLVLSLPVFAAGRAARPDWAFHALVAPTGAPLVEHDPNVAAVWTWDPAGSVAADDDLVRRLRAERFDAAVILHFRGRLARLLQRAGIRRRYGPWSKPASWLLLNRGTWQRRSRGGRHEADLNLDLLARLPGIGKLATPPPELYLSTAQLEGGRSFRREQAPDSRVVAFLHPGSGGSALDWPPERFAAVAGELASLPGWRVFVTGQGADAAAVHAMRGAGLDPRVGNLLDRYALPAFLGVLSAGDVFIGPSTGPLHLAGALGLGVVGIYPPVAAMSPRRWGPRARWSRVLVPAVDCPGRHACRLERCPLHNCLTGVDVRAVVAAARAVVGMRDGLPDTPER